MHKNEQRSFSDRFWNDSDGNLVVWQFPNWALWIWIGATLARIVLPHGNLEDYVGTVGKVAIIIWAIMEIGWGASYFRRLLGLAVLLLPLTMMLI